MPGGDRTGPMGVGPMTGRAAGYCAGYPAPGYSNPMPGRGFGMGFGRGRGRGRGRGMGFGRAWAMPYAAPVAAVPYASAAPTVEQESAALKQQVEHLEGVLGDLRDRIAELGSQESAEK